MTELIYMLQVHALSLQLHELVYLLCKTFGEHLVFQNSFVIQNFLSCEHYGMVLEE